jgi:hypothetical protein
MRLRNIHAHQGDEAAAVGGGDSLLDEVEVQTLDAMLERKRGGIPGHHAATVQEDRVGTMIGKIVDEGAHVESGGVHEAEIGLKQTDARGPHARQV